MRPAKCVGTLQQLKFWSTKRDEVASIIVAKLELNPPAISDINHWTLRRGAARFNH
jgi:hypothetical protein